MRTKDQEMREALIASEATESTRLTGEQRG